MKNKGTILACDRDGERPFTLKDYMARLGGGIVNSLRHDWTRDRIPENGVSVAHSIELWSTRRSATQE
jgi:16S rRNA C967 or C1407 C5-methylase (RsmB/RsmF family)